MRGIRMLALVACLAAPALAQEGGGVAVVHLADGSSVPLTNWAFSYEYHAWKEGTSPAHTPPSRRERRELLVGKKSLPPEGGQLEIQYRIFQRPVQGESEPRSEPWARVTGLVLTAAGKRNELKLEPPHKDLLLPEPKGMTLQARGVDLMGETLTGTRRSYCLFGFSSLVECSSAPAERVVRIEFTR
jgi:hypothetical protein